MSGDHATITLDVVGSIPLLYPHETIALVCSLHTNNELSIHTRLIFQINFVLHIKDLLLSQISKVQQTE